MIRKVSSRSVGIVLLLVSMALFQGCSSGSAGPTRELGTVTGTVTLDGMPLKKGIEINFTPNEGGSSQGHMDENGHYELVYSGGGLKGAVIGEHTVSFHDEGEEVSEEGYPLPGGGGEEAGIGIIPPEYTYEESQMTRKVIAGENIINFDLESK